MTQNLDVSVADFVASYEFDADDCHHVPDENERALITDALHGFIGQHCTRLSSPVSGTDMVMVEAWALVNRLRDQEADSVTVLCDNPEGPPNNAVECCGFWTGFAERRFEGDTIIAALRNAVSAKDAADQAGHPEMSAVLGNQHSAMAKMAFHAGWNAKERDVRDQLSDYDVYEAYDEFRARQASASPSTPIPVIAEAGEREVLLDGHGWVYWNPDAGEEYASSHPVQSGECCDAERIRKSTAQEDTLWQAMQDQFARAEALSTPATLDNTAVEGWQSPESAPKDGTVLELVVDYTDGHSPLQDATLACTVGWNDLENTGVDKWNIVGWDWRHDHIRDGAGTIRAWRPSRLMACDDGLPPLPQTAAEDVRNG